MLYACVVSGCTVTNATRIGPGRFAVRGDFVGAWRLVSWTSTLDGKTRLPFGPDARGLLIYTASGNMSVVLSQSNRTPFLRAEAKSGTPEEKATAYESCFAYSGTFEVAEGRVIHRL